MKKAGIPTEESVNDALVRELQWLRKGEGVTLRRLSSASVLLSLVSGTASAPGAGAETAVHAADRLLRQALDSLGHGVAAQALRAALAIDLEDPLTLTQRRYDFAARSERHPDTVENHENRAIEELALRIQGLARQEQPATSHAPSGNGGAGSARAAVAVPLEGDGDRITLIRTNRDLMDALLDVVHTAESCLAAIGSRSRDQSYLDAIERRLAVSPLIHYRVLCGPPHWPVLKDHLARLVAIKSAEPAGGNRRMFIGLVSDFLREPERFLCANERRAVVVLPSLNGAERYDTALRLEGEEFGMAYVRLAQEMYAAGQPIESEEDVTALPVVHPS